MVLEKLLKNMLNLAPCELWDNEDILFVLEGECDEHVTSGKEVLYTQ